MEKPCDLCVSTLTEWDEASRDYDKYTSVEQLDDELDESVDASPDGMSDAETRISAAAAAYKEHIQEHGWTA